MRDDSQIRRLVDRAVHALRLGHRSAADDIVRRLQRPEAREAVRAVLVESLESALAALWEKGWQPADVARVARRRLGKAAAESTAAAIVAHSRTYAQWGRAVAPEWMAQVDRLGAELPAAGWASLEVSTALEVFALMGMLPPLPQLTPPPSSWPKLKARPPRSGRVVLDPGVLERIRALLAKAESTEFDAEAEAFTAKAQELMTRHRIDRETLAGGEERHPREVIGRRVGIEDPYARQKFVLLSQVAAANGCRAAWQQMLGFATVFGHPQDVAGVEELFTSLLVQATRSMQRERPLHLRASGSAVARFRRSFMVGFAHRVGQRLASATADAVTAAEAETGVALVPLLAARERAAEETMQSTLGRVGTMSVSATDGLGYMLGREAADAADLRTVGGGKLPG